jgi:diguanylate cyclase (GGDEF)-like protein
MENLTETCRALPDPSPSSVNRKPCLVHIYPTGPGMGCRYSLGTRPLVIGRSNECEICINENSVSRRHVCIEFRGDGYYAVDLQSLNGTYVNNVPAPERKLEDGDYLRVGNCIYRFLSGGNVEADYHEEIYRLTIIDALTEIHNKRYFLEFLHRELVRAARRGRGLALVLFDVDRFKTINDEFGHLGGDLTLRGLAACVKQEIRQDELIARYGGEEFAIVLPETDLNAARALAERIRRLVASHRFQYGDRTYQVTISLGVAVTTGTEAITPTELINRADEKLYRAKREGRNRVVGDLVDKVVSVAGSPTSRRPDPGPQPGSPG